MRPISPQNLADVWSQIVQRHSILRTVFVPSVRADGAYDQVVVQNLDAQVTIHSADLGQQPPTTLTTFLHQLTLLPSSTMEVLCKLQMSHALVDCSSMSTLLSELLVAYTRSSISEDPLQYGEYVQYLHDTPSDAPTAFWSSTYQAGLPRT